MSLIPPIGFPIDQFDCGAFADRGLGAREQLSLRYTYSAGEVLESQELVTD